jgi:hypothetical protein
MTRTRKQIHEERRKLRSEYGVLYDKISELLFRHDPIGINFEHNTDEYEPEVGTILPRLKTCTSANELLQVVHEEFVRWFGIETAGSQDRYRKIADEIWHLLQRSAAPS